MITNPYKIHKTQAAMSGGSSMDIVLFWIPPKERSRATAVVLSGVYAGPAVAYPVCGVITKYYGWEAIFYVTGKKINRHCPIKSPLSNLS